MGLSLKTVVSRSLGTQQRILASVTSKRRYALPAVRDRAAQITGVGDSNYVAQRVQVR